MSRRYWILTVLLLILFGTLPARAGVGIWTPLGPDGGSVRSLAVSPANPNVVYAGMMLSGVFKSTDGGDTWTFAGRGLGPGDVVALAIDPQRPSTLYAMLYGTGVFRSTDAGRSWKITSPGGRPFLQTVGATLALDPRQPRVLYAGTRQGVYRSANGGVSWQARKRGLPPGSVVRSLAVDPATGAVFAGIDNHGVFRSDNQGVTWRPAGEGLPGDVAVFDLALDPADSRTILAGTSRGIYRSADQGRSWRLAGVPDDLVFAVALQKRGRAYAGTSRSGIFRSDDAGATWKPALDGPPDGGSVQAVAAGTGSVYAGTAEGRPVSGVFRSFDDGATWEPAQSGVTGVNIRSVAVDPADSRRLLAAFGTAGLARSGDGGESWEILDPGLPSWALPSFREIVFDPALPGTVYVTGVGNGDTLLRSDDAGETWQSVGQIPPGGPGPVASAARDPRRPGALWVAGGNGLYHSADRGETWQRQDLRDGSYIILEDVAVSPFDPARVYAAGYAVDGPRGQETFAPRLYASADGGTTWTRRDAGLEGRLSKVVPDPADPAVLWTFTYLAVYRSTDAGASWTRVLAANGGAFVDLAATTSAVYVALQGSFNGPSDVLRSTDRGRTWTSLRAGLDARIPQVLTVDPGNPARLLLGTMNGSILTWTELGR